MKTGGDAVKTAREAQQAVVETILNENRKNRDPGYPDFRFQDGAILQATDDGGIIASATNAAGTVLTQHEITRV